MKTSQKIFFLKIIMFGRPIYHFLIKVVGNRHYKLILPSWNKLSWFAKKKREQVIWKQWKEFWYVKFRNYPFICGFFFKSYFITFPITYYKFYTPVFSVFTGLNLWENVFSHLLFISLQATHNVFFIVFKSLVNKF